MTGRHLTALLALACVAAAPASRVTASVAAAVEAGAQMLSTADEGSTGGALTWASWTEQVPPTGPVQDSMLHLVLLRRVGSTVRPVWHARRPGGHGPVLRVMPWMMHRRPVMLLQFQYGAAYTRMELYAVQPGGLPAMRGSVEGSWIDITGNGPNTILSAHSSSDLQDAPRCYSWEARAAKLSVRSC